MDLPEVLWALSEWLEKNEWEEWFGWLPPTCPYCNSPLSGKFGSERLLCLKCNREFELREVVIE
ncbi:MAG: hypothetical protein QXN24_04895 [Candidatus Bathyarchaeia archaeon]